MMCFVHSYKFLILNRPQDITRVQETHKYDLEWATEWLRLSIFLLLSVLYICILALIYLEQHVKNKNFQQPTMLESNIIKRFIVKTFTQNSGRSLKEITLMVMKILEAKFFLNETILIKSTDTLAKVVQCDRDMYVVQIASDKITARHSLDELARKSTVQFEDVLSFLECSTKPTPFGRMLIENVFEKIVKPGFGAQSSESIRAERTHRQAYDYREIPRPKDYFDIVARLSNCEDDRMYSAEQTPGKFARDVRKIPNAHSHTAETGQQQLETEAQEHEGSGRNTPSKRVKTRPSQVIVTDLRPFAIEDFEGAALKKLIKVYMLLNSFRVEFGLDAFTIEDVASAVKDPEYSSKLIFDIHRNFIEIVESESRARGQKAYECFGCVIDGLPAYETDMETQPTKKRGKMTAENWKQQAKIFIHNLSRETASDKVLQFLVFSKKDAIDIRLSFLAFLIDLLTFTDRFREFVDAKQNELRIEKGRFDDLHVERKRKLGDIDEIRSRMFGVEKEMVAHSLRIHMGKYRKFPLFYMDGKILLKDGNSFYTLTRQDVKSIMRDIDPQTRANRTTIANLKQTAEVVFSSA